MVRYRRLVRNVSFWSVLCGPETVPRSVFQAVGGRNACNIVSIHDPFSYVSLNVPCGAKKSWWGCPCKAPLTIHYGSRHQSTATRSRRSRANCYTAALVSQ